MKGYFICLIGLVTIAFAFVKDQPARWGVRLGVGPKAPTNYRMSRVGQVLVFIIGVFIFAQGILTIVGR